MPIDFRYKIKGSWTALGKELAMPLNQIGVFWRDSVRTRVSNAGIGASGPLTPYVQKGSFSPFAKDGDTRHWVPPSKPQPDSAGRKVKHGRFKDWAIYPSRAFYQGLLGKRGPRKLKQSGKFWASLKVTVVTINHTRIHFVGSTMSGKGGIRYRRLARDLMAKERQGLLVPTDQEWAVIQGMMRDAISDQLLDAQGIAAESHSLRVQTARAQSRAAKIVKRL